VRKARTHLWYDVAWPVVTGLATGAGLVAACVFMGPGWSVLALVVLELTLAPVAWSLLTEMGFDVARVTLRVAPAVSVFTLAVVGLADALGAWTMLLGGFVLATSPLLRGWTHGGFRTTLAERVSPRTETRRRFDEIVAQGFGPSDDEPPSR
jgi:hypothetical protein